MSATTSYGLPNGTFSGFANGNLSSKQRLPSSTLIGLDNGNLSSKQRLPSGTLIGLSVATEQQAEATTLYPHKVCQLQPKQEGRPARWYPLGLASSNPTAKQPTQGGS